MDKPKATAKIIYLSALIQIGMGLYLGSVLYQQASNQTYAAIALAAGVLHNIYTGIKERNQPLIPDTSITPKNKPTLSQIVAFIIIGLFIFNNQVKYVDPTLSIHLLLLFFAGGLATSFIPLILKSINK